MTGDERLDTSGGTAPDRLLGPGPAARLERWASAARVDEAARARSRRRSLHRAAVEDATAEGVLVELAETRRRVVLTTAAGRAHRGTLGAVGSDFVAVCADRTAAMTLVHRSAVASVRAFGADVVVGEARVTTEVDLRSVLCGLAERRVPVRLATGRGPIAEGEIAWVGLDVLALRSGPGAPDDSTTYVALATLDEVVTG